MFLEGFDSVEDVLDAFEAPEGALENATVLAAAYSCDSYDGSASVVFVKEGKVYEVYGSHCSCYGLEGQWEPEETTAKALLSRLYESYDYQVEHDPNYVNYVQAVVNGLIDEIFEREVLLQ